MGKFSDLDIEIQVNDVNDGKNKLIKFYGIKKSDIFAILGKLTTKIPGSPVSTPDASQNILKIWAKSDVLHIIISKDKIDNFIDTGLKTMQFVLAKSQNYEGNSIGALTDEVWSKCTTISYEDQKKIYADSEASEIVQWQEYLNNVNDPKTKEMLILYSQIYGDTVYGHTLSIKNAMTIRRYAPEATFVLGKSIWQKYGRGIKRGAKPIPLWAGAPPKPNKSDIAQAQKVLGHGNSNFDELGKTVQDAIEKEASKIALDKNGGKMSTFRYWGYDIADTYRHSTKIDDPLQSQPGIIGNVAYKLNQLAQELEDKKNANRGKDLEGHDTMIAKTEKASEIVIEACNELNIKPDTKSQDAGTRLANSLLNYYKPMVREKSNILKDSNIDQFAEDAVQLTLLMTNVGLNLLNRFQHSYIYTQKEAAAMAPIIRKMVDKIGRGVATISESILKENKNDFLSRFKLALKQLGIKVVKDNQGNVGNNNPINNPTEINANNNNPIENNTEIIKENFYKVFNKINSNIF